MDEHTVCRLLLRIKDFGEVYHSVKDRLLELRSHAARLDKRSGNVNPLFEEIIVAAFGQLDEGALKYLKALFREELGWTIQTE